MSEFKNTTIDKMSKDLEEHFGKCISKITREELFNYIKEKYVVGYTYFTVATKIKYMNATLQMNNNDNTFMVREFGVTLQGGNNITKREVIEYIKVLDNPQDKFILYCLFCGIYGKQAEDLITMTTDMIDLENGKIKLKDREVVMDEIMKKIVVDTLNETTYYILDTGKVWRTTEFNFNMSSPYVIKQRPSTANNNGVNHMTYNGFRTRIKNLLGYLDSDLKVIDIVTSGYAYRIYNEVESISTQSIKAWLKKNNIRSCDYKLRKVVNELYGL